MAKTSDVLTTGEVARICKVAPRTVSKWFDTGRLEGYRIPGSKDRRIPRAALREFMAKHGIPLDSLESDKPRALIIGGQSPNNTHLERMLAENEFEVQSADSIFAAGILAERHKPQVIIWEVEADQQKTKEIPKDIRAIAGLCNAKLLAVTDSGHNGQELQDCGFDACLSEPVDEPKLIGLVRELAGSTR
ncbi:MAG: helix-turn-helix domain-containing protein [Actinobacteria bacterium]|nr:helix-turn-helix domain-containing protein [Actinomycetota bacterium]